MCNGSEKTMSKKVSNTTNIAHTTETNIWQVFECADFDDDGATGWAVAAGTVMDTTMGACVVGAMVTVIER